MTNRVFLEFVRAERLIGDAPPGFWFEEIFKLGVLGLNPSVGSAEEVKAKQAWLPPGDTAAHLSLPRVGWTPHLVRGRRGGYGVGPAPNPGSLLPVEAIYAAATLGLNGG